MNNIVTGEGDVVSQDELFTALSDIEEETFKDEVSSTFSGGT